MAQITLPAEVVVEAAGRALNSLGADDDALSSLVQTKYELLNKFTLVDEDMHPAYLAEYRKQKQECSILKSCFFPSFAKWKYGHGGAGKIKFDAQAKVIKNNPEWFVCEAVDQLERLYSEGDDGYATNLFMHDGPGGGIWLLSQLSKTKLETEKLLDYKGQVTLTDEEFNLIKDYIDMSATED